MTEAKFKDWEFFNDTSLYHVCCSCCNGYCPLWDDIRKPVLEHALWVFEVDGREYLSDRHQAILASLVAVESKGNVGHYGPLPKERRDLLTVPTEKPGPSKQPLHPVMVCNAIRLGIDIRNAGRHESQHLYMGDEHVGRTMPMTSGGMRLSEVRRVNQIATRLETYGPHLDIHPWQLAVDALRLVGPDVKEWHRDV